MELIDRYASAVGKRLPRKNRADIEAEIRSTLQDMLDDRARETGRPVDAAMVKEVLVEYGAPEKVAATYTPQNYLIGPRMFPILVMVGRIVFIVLTVLALVGFGIRVGTGALTVQAIADQLTRSLLEYIQGMIVAFGNLVLVLAILERVLPDAEIAKELKEAQTPWDPDSLMKEPEPDEVKIWDPILAIVFTFIAIAAFNLFPQIFRVTPSLNDFGSDKVVWLPLLSQAFFDWLPWIDLLWGLQIVLNLVLLRMLRWTTATRLAEIALQLFGIGLGAAMLAGPSLIGLTLADFNALTFDPEAAKVLVAMSNLGVRLGITIAIIASAFDMGKSVYRLVKRLPHGKPLSV